MKMEKSNGTWGYAVHNNTWIFCGQEGRDVYRALKLDIKTKNSTESLFEASLEECVNILSDVKNHEKFRKDRKKPVGETSLPDDRHEVHQSRIPTGVDHATVRLTSLWRRGDNHIKVSDTIPEGIRGSNRKKKSRDANDRKASSSQKWSFKDLRKTFC